MIEKSKKDKIFEPFEDDLFCQEHVDIINEKVEKNIPTLLGNDIYLDIDDKIVDLNLKLNSILNKEQLKTFNGYLNTALEASLYKNCLAYYLGLQDGIKIGELK